MAAPKRTLTHFDAGGRAHMVDVGAKKETRRIAVARGRISLKRATLDTVLAGGAKKGDVLGVARLAAIQGAKRTPDLIPLAHPLALTRVAADFTVAKRPPAITCTVTAETVGRTGVEMEALTACTIALLTIYDMLKAADRGMRIEAIELVEKQGGKSGHWRRA
jgi:cyclic pyranopterin phosphate synthase